MSRSLLIRIAASLAAITGIGHTIGTFMPVPVEAVAMHAAIATMTATMVPMPVGAARSYMQIFDGNNLCTSLLLFLCAAHLFASAKAPAGTEANRAILITAAALGGIAVISARYFFPVPAVFTALGAVLCVAAVRRPS
jgi:hypothetical protein